MPPPPPPPPPYGNFYYHPFPFQMPMMLSTNNPTFRFMSPITAEHPLVSGLVDHGEDMDGFRTSSTPAFDVEEPPVPSTEDDNKELERFIPVETFDHEKVPILSNHNVRYVFVL